jgi:heme A synthase
MSRRTRALSFGAAGLLVLAGALGAILVSGGTGQILALVLISLGFVLATSLVFLEVGLSEDRELERERRRRERASRSGARGRPRRLPRLRGSRRRL